MRSRSAKPSWRRRTVCSPGREAAQRRRRAIRRAAAVDEDVGAGRLRDDDEQAAERGARRASARRAVHADSDAAPSAERHPPRRRAAARGSARGAPRVPSERGRGARGALLDGGHERARQLPRRREAIAGSFCSARMHDRLERGGTCGACVAQRLAGSCIC